MARVAFSEEERQQLRRERFEHPHPRVQLRMEVLWLISCGESYASAARLAGAYDATVDRYVALYREHGIEGLKQFDWKGQTSQLAAHRTSLEELFLADSPHTIAEACRRIEEATGVKRGPTQVRHLLKKSRTEVALHGGGPVASEENRRGTCRDSGRVSRRKTGTSA